MNYYGYGNFDRILDSIEVLIIFPLDSKFEVGDSIIRSMKAKYRSAFSLFENFALKIRSDKSPQQMFQIPIKIVSILYIEVFLSDEH